jgi:hypothetical protein
MGGSQRHISESSIESKVWVDGRKPQDNRYIEKGEEGMKNDDRPYYRQGDIILEPIKDLDPKKLTARRDNVLAIGEATGHRHWLDTAFPAIYEDDYGNEYVKLIEDAVLVHGGEGEDPVWHRDIARQKDVHIALVVKAGEYKVLREHDRESLSTHRTSPVID